MPGAPPEIAGKTPFCEVFFLLFVYSAQAKKYEQLGYFIAGIKNEGILIDVTSTAGTKTSELVKVTITGNLNY